MNEHKALILFCGPPGVGKTTMAKEIAADPAFACYGEYVRASSDDFVERFARYHGLTYSEAYPLAIERASRRMNRIVRRALAEGQSVIWDQTNLTWSIRNRRAERFRQAGYQVGLVWAQINNWWSLIERNLSRDRSLDRGLVCDMVRRYEQPTEEELKQFDFSLVIKVD